MRGLEGRVFQVLCSVIRNSFHLFSFGGYDRSDFSSPFLRLNQKGSKLQDNKCKTDKTADFLK